MRIPPEGIPVALRTKWLTPDPAGRWKGITTFTSHEAVICLRCKTSLAEAEVESADLSLGCGAYRKKCPKCQLRTSYNVSPAEATAIELEEPDWKARFLENLPLFQPRELAEDTAFEQTLKDWRRFHVKQGKPAAAADAMIALANLGILPPRNLIKDVPRDGECLQEQHDDHCWLIMSQRAWRIVTIESRMMFLESFGEKTQIDLTRAKWEKYTEKAVEALKALKANWPPANATTPGASGEGPASY